MPKAKVGDRIRILYDGTCSTTLKAGDIVTVKAVCGRWHGSYSNLKGGFNDGEGPRYQATIFTTCGWELPEEAYELAVEPEPAVNPESWVSYCRRR